MKDRRIVASLALLAAFAVSHSAAAQTTKDSAFQVEHFEPLPAQSTNVGNVASSRTLESLQPSFGLLFHYVDDPLQVREDDEVENRLLQNQAKAELTAAIGIFEWADVGLAAPLVLFQTTGDLTDFGTDDASSTTLGDIRLMPRARFLDPEKMGGFGAAGMLVAYLPTGDANTFNGDGTFRLEPRLIADWSHDIGLRILANVGYQIRPQREALTYVSDDLLRVAIGAEYRVDALGLGAFGTIFGQRSLAEGRDPLDFEQPAPNSDAQPIEAQLGVRADLPANLMLQIGGGFGLTSDVGSPDFRLLAGIGWVPSIRQDADGDGIRDGADECPSEDEDLDGFEDDDGCADYDNDGDRILDNDDQCPLEAEDFDDFEDEDGCPDNDNDGDGIVDDDDRCLNQEGPAGNMGCPPEDNDGDGIFDHLEECPSEPEDVDGFEDDDGCPDHDNDGDGLLDGADVCPNKPEVINENDDTDGCPDPGESYVSLTDSAVALTKDVEFSSRTRISRSGRRVLNQVAALMKNHAEIETLRVEVHTSAEGEEDANQELSQRQADAIVAYLSDRGLSSERLVGAGMGEGTPDAEGKPRARVELLVEKAPEPEAEKPSPPEDTPEEDSGFDFSGGDSSSEQPPAEQPAPNEAEEDEEASGFQFGEDEVQ